MDKEITTRIQKANQALGRLRTKVLQHKGLRLATKLKVYNAVVISSLLYGCETWILYRRHVKQLEQFHTRSLRSIMRIRWQDRVTNQEVLDRANSSSIEAKILQAQLRWTGHVIRMDETRIPRQLFYGELVSGHRKQGRPKKRYKDNLKTNLKWAGVHPKELETSAADRSGWRVTIRSAANNFEKDRRQRLAAARERRHRAASSAPPTEGIPCEIYKSNLCLRIWTTQSHAFTPLTLF